MQQALFEVILLQPAIPSNTGKVIGRGANASGRPHRVQSLGLRRHDRQLKRAGLHHHDDARGQVYNDWPALLRLPMAATSRSLSLSNTVAVVIYEAWRRNGFAGRQW